MKRVDGELIVMPRLESGTTLDSDPAIGTNQDLSMLVRQQPILARVRPARHAFDGRYSNVENRVASSPDRLWSRIECGRGTRAEPCQLVALQMDAIVACRE